MINWKRKSARKPKLKRKITKKSFPWEKRDNIQNSIPFECIYDDGVCALGHDLYSATFSFEDTNYSNTLEIQRIDTFEKYCEFLNAFDDTQQFQIHILTKQLSKTNLNLFIAAPDNASDELLLCVDEYNQMLQKRMNGNNSFIQLKYITITIQDNSYENAAARFDRIDGEILDQLRRIGCTTKKLNKLERLSVLRDMSYWTTLNAK